MRGRRGCSTSNGRASVLREELRDHLSKRYHPLRPATYSEIKQFYFRRVNIFYIRNCSTLNNNNNHRHNGRSRRRYYRLGTPGAQNTASANPFNSSKPVAIQFKTRFGGVRPYRYPDLA